MKLFTVYFNDEIQPISIRANNQLKALAIAVASFKDKIGQITVFEDTISDFLLVKLAGHRDFGKKTLSKYQGRIGVVLTDQEIGIGKFVCLDHSDQEREGLYIGEEINLRLCWDSQLADADEWWEFQTNNGSIYKTNMCDKNEINLKLILGLR